MTSETLLSDLLPPSGWNRNEVCSVGHGRPDQSHHHDHLGLYFYLCHYIYLVGMLLGVVPAAPGWTTT